MWYFFNEKASNPITLKRDVLSLRHSNMISKSLYLYFFFVFIFLGGFLVNKFVFEKSKTKVKIEKHIPKYGILFMITFLNFYINKLNLFMYKQGDVTLNPMLPNNPNFFNFLICIIIIMGGFLFLNSKFVPEAFHTPEVIQIKNPTKYKPGEYIIIGLFLLNLLYALSNIFLDPDSKAYFAFSVLGLIVIVTLAIYNQGISTSVLFSSLSLFMIDNFKYIINRQVSGIWYKIHYLLYASQIGITIYSLIKSSNFF